MSLITKSVILNQGLRRCSALFSSPNQLRLSSAHYSSFLRALVHCQSKSADCKGPEICFVPERKLTTEHFRQMIKTKITDAYDTVRYMGKTEERILGVKWYSTLDGLNVQEFLNFLELSDTFYSWFKITELHTWMILLNLPQSTRDQRIVRIGVINAMWTDTEKRSKLLAPDNRNFKKDMRELYQRFRVSLILYDEGYLNSDRELTSVLWFNFFDKRNVDPRLIEVLVSYIRYQVRHLHEVKFTPDNVEAKISNIWTPLAPHHENVFKKM